METIDIVCMFAKFIIEQAQVEYDFDIKDVIESNMNNGCLYITLPNNRTEAIQLYGKLLQGQNA